MTGHLIALDERSEVADPEHRESQGWEMLPVLARFEGVIGAALLVLLASNLVLIIAVTLLRYFMDVGVVWSIQVSQLLLAGLLYLGSAIAFHRGEHRSLRLVLDLLPDRLVGVLDAFTLWLSLAFSAFLAYSGTLWMTSAYGNIVGTGVPEAVQSLPIILGSAVMIVYVIALLMSRPKAAALLGLAAAIVFLGLMRAGIYQFGGAQNLGTAFMLGLIVLLCLLLLGMPIAYCFGIVTVVLILCSDGLVSIEGVARRSTESASSFILLAVPFFIAAGLLMEAGDVTTRLINVARSFLGHVRGGMGHVMVGSMYFMSGVTGSEAADTAAVGTVMRKSMRDSGWSPGETTGILIAGTVMGATVPPSIGLIVVAASAELSVGTLFWAGFLPALVLAIVLSFAVYIRARTLGIQGLERATWGDRARAIKAAAFAAGLPIIVMGGMLGGFGTPTELSAFAVMYVLLVELLVHRKLGWRHLGKVGVDAAVLTGMILFIVATASGLVYVGTFASIPQQIGTSLASVAGSNAVAFTFLTVLALIPLGMLMEGLAALLVFPGLLMPTAIAMGVDPIHYGILMFIAVMVGGNMPPLGAGFYFAASVLKAPIKASLLPSYGYLGIVTTGLCVLVVSPGLVLLVPRLVGSE